MYRETKAGTEKLYYRMSILGGAGGFDASLLSIYYYKNINV